MNEFDELAVFEAADGIDIERAGHRVAASFLDVYCPGQWCYRYANLIDGVTIKTAGVIVSKYDPNQIDGVTDMNLIADGGFSGQFQWIDGGLGGKVPASVTTIDPEREARYEAARQQAHLEAEAAMKAMNERVALLPPFQIVAGKEAEYAEWMAEQRKDGYSGAAVNYGERWAILMQEQLGDGYTPEYLGALAERASHEADLEGVTGNMYGWAVHMLAHFWTHGEALRRWHNHEYGHDGDGVVNPAVLTLEVAE